MPTPPSAPAASPEDSWFWKNFYIQHAYSVSYIMQGKSAGQSAWSWVLDQVDDLVGGGHQKPPRIQSFLGGAFLRMYLDHDVDANIVQQAGEEIGKSKEFAALTRDVTKQLQHLADTTQKPLDEAMVKAGANKYLQQRLKHGGISFRDTLNAVIGGVGGIEVTEVKLGPVGTKNRTGKVELEFVLSVKLSDVYDFQNKRSGEYQRYREHLKTLLRANRYADFNLEYFGEVSPISSQHKTHLDLAGTFASFMYAVEGKGWTPGGLAWDVTIPMTIKIRDLQRR